MQEITEMESYRNAISVNLDIACNDFLNLATEALAKGLYIDADMNVCGEAHLLAANSQLKENIERIAAKIQSLTDELKEAEENLSNLYNTKFEELLGAFRSSRELSINIPILQRMYKEALMTRSVVKFLSEVQNFLANRR